MKTNLFSQFWEAQGGRCFECATPIRLNQACKKSRSFRIVCQSCYLEPEFTVWIDEAAPIDYERIAKIANKANNRKEL